MRLLLIAANTFAAIFSFVWMWGRSTTAAGDWEFWFALGYLILALTNLAYFLLRGTYRPSAEEAEEEGFEDEPEEQEEQEEQQF